MLFLFLVFVFSLPFLGLWLGRGLGGFIEYLMKKGDDVGRTTYIDKSVHYHIHEHGDKYITNENHLHQNLTVIDEETHKRGLEKFENENKKAT